MKFALLLCNQICAAFLFISIPGNSTISQSLCAGALFCWKLQSAAKVKLSSQKRESDSFWVIFVAAMVKPRQFATRTR